MTIQFRRLPVSLAVVALVSSAALLTAPQAFADDKGKGNGYGNGNGYGKDRDDDRDDGKGKGNAKAKPKGVYLAGDFHNHTTCSDGATSMQKLVRTSMDSPWGLDWFVQAGHGGTGNRNCTLTEDESLATPGYPFVAGQGPTTTWANSIGADKLKGDVSGSGATRNMWRWQAIQEVQYQILEQLAERSNQPLFLGLESVVAGHEHTSMSVITGQMPFGDASATPLVLNGYTPLPPGSPTAKGNATALAQWTYCFDRGNTDTSRGNKLGTPAIPATPTTPAIPATSAIGNNWECSVPGSLNAADPSWNSTAQKLVPTGSTGVGERGHNKTVEAVKWMAAFHPQGSYYVPAHLERAGPFNPNGNNGFNVEHLRNFNNAAPMVAFGFETQPGHGASDNRGEYGVGRNNPFSTGGPRVDTVGGTTYGGTGVYGAVVGGVWDALLGEGRNFWFFASSDWHNRGAFGVDDRRSTQDFWPGEYQRNYTMVRNKGELGNKLRPKLIVDGLRSGNNFAASGQLIDRMAFVACASYQGKGYRPDAAVEAMALKAALSNTDVDTDDCATMGEKLEVRPGADIVVSIVVRDPDGENIAPYSFDNPSLAQVGISQPLNKPVLDHIDLIRGMVTGFKTPGSADYSGEWPRNTNWLREDGTTVGLDAVPAAAKNTSAKVLKTFNGDSDKPSWKSQKVAGGKLLKMTFRIPAVKASQYLRLRGTNLPASVPFETDADGNPLSDLYTNASNPSKLTIDCKVAPSAPDPATLTTGTIDGCPGHLEVVNGQKKVSYDVAAWADLWFYSNPIFVQVNGSSVVAGVN